MSDAKIRGIVHFVDETKTYGQNGFRKRLVVLEQESGSFTNYIPVEFIRDDCDSVDGMKVGNEVEINYRLNGRKWQRDPKSEVKYFLNAEATGFKNLSGSAPSAGDATAASPASANDAFAEAAYDEEDIPF